MKRIVFVCTENANRSQMAEGFSRHHGADILEAYSAGSSPSGVVNPKAVSAMAEKGIDISAQRSASTSEMEGPFDAIISMGCGDQCPWLPGRHREDWGLDDPRDMDPEAYALVRDSIETKVLDLIERFRSGAL